MEGQSREDGGIRITSVEVPGLLLSGRDEVHVRRLLKPTLQGLLEANDGIRVSEIVLHSDHAEVLTR